MEKKYKKYALNDNVTIQVLSYTDQMMTAQIWFTGPGFEGTHHHSNQEVNVVISGEFEATDGDNKYNVFPGQVVPVLSDRKHNMECLTPTGSMITIWTPARKDIIDNYTEIQ